MGTQAMFKFSMLQSCKEHSGTFPLVQVGMTFSSTNQEGEVSSLLDTPNCSPEKYQFALPAGAHVSAHLPTLANIW